MIIYRIASRIYARDLSGNGALLYGGRWNPKGIRMLYTSGSLSLAALETIANLSSNKLQMSLYCIELEVPDSLSIETPSTLTDGWNSFPYTQVSLKIGADFIKNNGFCLKVPSAIIPTEFNFLLNPLHPDFDHVKIHDSRPFLQDQRLI